MAIAGIAFATFGAHVSTAGADVVLNEINCDTDFVELVNTSATDEDISGWLLTDDPLATNRADHRMFFPTPTTIPAGETLLVNKGMGGYPLFPFGISCGNDVIRLADDTPAMVEEVSVPVLSVGTNTWGRYPNGTGDFTETASTPGAPNELPSGGDADAAAWMFEPETVVEIELGIPPASREALAADHTEYQDGTFALETTGGSYAPLDVGIRLKGGAGSFRTLDGKAAFKIKFNHSVSGQRFLGLKKLTLNNMVQDPSNLHEALAYELFRARGVPAPRTGYAYVSVDGEDYGLYLNLETLDDVSLPRHFATTQHLYEGENGADLFSYQARRFEVDQGAEDDFADLDALIAAVEGPGRFSERVADLTDLGQMIRMWAVERYIAHWDGYSGGLSLSPFIPNNYYLHSDADGRFRMLPWGTDQTWVHRLDFVGQRGPGGILFRNCMEDPSCFASFRAAVREVRSTTGTLGLDARATSLAAVLAPWQAIDPRREYSTEQIEEGVAATRAFIAARPADVDDSGLWVLPADMGGAYDDAALDTWFATGPRPLIRTRFRRARASFSFDSSAPGSRFQCKLDDAAWIACSSPFSIRAGRGRHALRVRAIAGGDADASPATWSWRVAGRRRARSSRRR